MSRKYYQRKESIDARRDLFNAYNDKYFNLFLNSYKWNGISRDQREYIMRKFWEIGSVCAFSIIKPNKEFLGVTAESFSDGLIGFATFAPQNFNMYNYPTRVLAINERGVPYIPSKLLKSNVDVVLGYAQHTRQPIYAVVKNYLDRIVDIEMSIRTNVIAHKLPLVFEVTPESQNKAEDLTDKLLNDDSLVFSPVKTIDAIKGVSTGIPFIVDKLQDYKVSLENELLTYLGIDNIGAEKKERLIVDEANANNDLIEDYKNSILDNLKEFCEEINRVLGFNISIKKEEKKEEVTVNENNELL